jgi:hypothetical protein
MVAMISEVPPHRGTARLCGRGERGDGLGECRDRFPGRQVVVPHERDGRPCAALASRPRPARTAVAILPGRRTGKSGRASRGRSPTARREEVRLPGWCRLPPSTRAPPGQPPRPPRPSGGCRRSHAARRTERRSKIHNMSGIAQQCYRARANPLCPLEVHTSALGGLGTGSGVPVLHPPRWFVAGRAGVCHTASMRYPGLGLSCSLFLLWGSAAAHEVRLKDGGKLRGITVGYGRLVQGADQLRLRRTRYLQRG